MSNENLNDAVVECLAQERDPYHGQPFSKKQFSDLKVENGKLTATLTIGYPALAAGPVLSAQLSEAATKVDGVDSAEIKVESKIETHAVQKKVKPFGDIKNIIAVASGKGGVGKSTVSANLALALKEQGATVGLMDADIFGPSVPMLVGSDAYIDKNHDEILEPVVCYGVQTISAGYLTKKDAPILWRGPMVSQALSHLMNETYWADLDYLIIDMPPGTGDVQLSLAQEIPTTGAVIVTTPQDVALLDARKAVAMFQQLEVDIVGVVENMSVHICEECGHKQHIFGQGGALKMAEDFNIDELGKLPLDISIREGADSGRPTMVSDPDGDIAAMYRDIAIKAAARISVKPKDYSDVMPEVVVQNG